MKDRSPDAALAECPEHHLHHPILDDATTAATTFSLLITSACLTPGTSSSSTTDALIKYNAEFQDALTKHQEDRLCFLNNCATSGTPAIPTNMINKVRTANLEMMKKINQKASWNGGKKLSTKKLKELGAQAEKAAKVQYVANCDSNNAMEQERLPLKKDMLVQPVNNPWTPILPHGFDILPMEQDGNCLYRSVSDQLFHDKGAGHVIVCHQINNHI
jgi:hypothetical protein